MTQADNIVASGNCIVGAGKYATTLVNISSTAAPLAPGSQSTASWSQCKSDDDGAVTANGGKEYPAITHSPLKSDGRVFFARADSEQFSLQACLDSLTRPGDECRLHPGRYHAPSAAQPFTMRGRHGSADAPMVVGALAGTEPGEIIFDGTVAVGPWHRVAPDDDAAPVMYRATLPQPVWQLFDKNHEYQVPARWPDAFWHDKSVFQVRKQIRVALFAARTLNATGQPRVTLSRCGKSI